MTYEQIPLQGGTAATLLADLDEVCTLVNADASNVAILGEVNTVQPGDQESVPLGPGQLLSVDGSSQTFGTIAPNAKLTILKFPGVVQLGTSTPRVPTTASPLVASGTASNGGNVVLISNPSPTYQIQLLSCSLAAMLSASPAPTPFSGFDSIRDSVSLFNYLLMPVSMSNAGDIFLGPITQDMGGAIVPPLHSLNLVAAAAAGTVHTVTATVVYYLVHT